jgi:hypothetical protein
MCRADKGRDNWENELDLRRAKKVDKGENRGKYRKRGCRARERRRKNAECKKQRRENASQEVTKG